jgi:hypothetical protein
MPRPKKPFNQQKWAGCRRCGHRPNHSRDNCPAEGVKCFKYAIMGNFTKSSANKKTVTTILSRIISSRRSLYPKCSDNVQSEVTKFSTFSLSSCIRLLNFALSKIAFLLTMKWLSIFQVAAPESFNFSKPETWHKWIQRFDRFRSPSGLEDKSGVTQVNSLINSMGASQVWRN